MSPPRSIVHVISSLDGYAAAQQLRILAMSQKSSGQNVHIIAFRAHVPLIESWRADGLHCRVLQGRWRFDPFAFWRLTELLKNSQPDVIHAWDPDAAALVALAKERAGQPRCFATLLLPPPVWTGYLRKFDGFAIATENLSVDYVGRGVSHDDFMVVPPAIGSSPERHNSKRDFLTNLGLPEATKLVVTVGPLVRSKRLDEAIWHFELVRTLEENAVMLVLGDGPERHRLERYARLVSEPAAIKFLGYCQDMPAYVSLADVVWHTSEDSAISMAVLESMAAGVPVVASDVPINRSLIEAGTTGFLASAGSRAMFARYTLRLLEDEQLRSEIGAAAAAEAKRRFSTAQMIGQYQELYDRVIVNSAKP